MDHTKNPREETEAHNNTLVVKGLSHSRPTADLEPVDLTDEAKTRAVFEAFEPDWVIHCAAERRPDVADKVTRRRSLSNLRIADVDLDVLDVDLAG